MRYSAVHALHKELEISLPSSQNFVFPPKKLANSGVQFVEGRRIALEGWFAAVLAQQDSLGSLQLLSAIQTPNSAMVWAREYVHANCAPHRPPLFPCRSGCQLATRHHPLDGRCAARKLPNLGFEPFVLRFMFVLIRATVQQRTRYSVAGSLSVLGRWLTLYSQSLWFTLDSRSLWCTVSLLVIAYGARASACRLVRSSEYLLTRGRWLP
jgi:hypothetical protein